MYDKQKQEKTCLTLESYGNVYRFEANHCDSGMEEMLYAFYGLLTAATWSPITILKAMKEFAGEHLKLLESNQNMEENENETY